MRQTPEVREMGEVGGPEPAKADFGHPGSRVVSYKETFLQANQER
jgi:hypothetical protein